MGGITTVVWRIFKEKWTERVARTRNPSATDGNSLDGPRRLSLPTVDLTIGITNSSFARVDLNLGSASGNTMTAYAPNNLFQFPLPDVESGNQEQVGVAG